MKNAVLASLLIALIPLSASALAVDDLVTVAAMPLAVAAVADIADVPTSDLIDLIVTMNQAQVPAPQFIEVVRYAPVALVDTRQPFVPYVTTQVERGVTGQELALVMEDRIETYEGADTINVVTPQRVVDVDETFYPQVVVTRFQPVQFDPLSLIAMPLAVAAASRIADVPPMELASLVTLLNEARVPPAQFVEVVRFSPVALIDTDPQFLTYVTTQVSDGRRGIVLARDLGQRLEVLGANEINVVTPPRVWVAEARSSHPHGGPPGQLKKELGLQTGAEVVHGSKPGKPERTARVTERRAGKPERVARPPKVKAAKHVERVKPARVERVERVKPQHIDRGNAKPDRVAKAPKQKQSGGGAAKSKPGHGQGKGKGKA